MSDLREIGQWLREHPGESIFDDPDRERRKLAQEWGDRVLFWALVAVAMIAAGELVLRLGLGIRTFL